MPILTIDYYAAKRLVEFYESLTDCASKAIELRLAGPATDLNAILNAEAAAYIEAQRLVATYDREQAERTLRRHAATQLMLAPMRRPEVLL